MWGARRTPALLLAVILAALPRVAGAPERPSDVDNLQETQKAGVRQVTPALTADVPTPEEAAEARVADLVPEEYRRVVVETATRHGVDARLLAAVAWVETGGTWQPDLEGAAGEVGLMQVLPSTAAWIAEARGLPYPDLTDPAVALDFGAWYLAHLIDTTGDPWEAVHQYNGGPEWRTRAPTQVGWYGSRVRELADRPVAILCTKEERAECGAKW